MPASIKGFAEAKRQADVADPTRVTVHEAKTHLSRLLARVEKGETVVITRRGKPIAKLLPAEGLGPREPGGLKGLVSIDERFFEPLPEDELRAWEGG